MTGAGVEGAVERLLPEDGLQAGRAGEAVRASAAALRWAVAALSETPGSGHQPTVSPEVVLQAAAEIADLAILLSKLVRMTYTQLFLTSMDYRYAAEPVEDDVTPDQHGTAMFVAGLQELMGMHAFVQPPPTSTQSALRDLRDVRAVPKSEGDA